MNISKDYKFGIDKENLLLETLKEKFGNDLEKSTSKTSYYDYSNKDILVELKSRRNNYQKYPTTMIGENKIKYFLSQTDKTCYTVFSFTDGIYYCKIDKELLKHCKVKKGGRCDRGSYEIKDYRFIPIEQLQQLNDIK